MANPMIRQAAPGAFLRTATLCGLLLAGLAGCGGQGPDPASMRTLDRQERQLESMGSLTGGKGLTLTPGGGQSASNGDGGSLPVSAYLWRAALDTLSFLPLAQSDPLGGVIISDWYSPPETPDTRFKVTAYILTQTLRSDGVRVAVFKEQRADGAGWRTVDPGTDTATRLEDAILVRARQMRAGGLLAAE